MEKHGDPRYFNKSAYVSLLCLIAFAVVISICLFKQFIWDSLLSPRFQRLRPILSESMRKLSPIFSRAQSTLALNSTLKHSVSDAHIEQNESTLLSNFNTNPISPTIIYQDDQLNSNNENSLHRSYGSSSKHSYAYTNVISEE